MQLRKRLRSFDRFLRIWIWIFLCVVQISSLDRSKNALEQVFIIWLHFQLRKDDDDNKIPPLWKAFAWNFAAAAEFGPPPSSFSRLPRRRMSAKAGPSGIAHFGPEFFRPHVNTRHSLNICFHIWNSIRICAIPPNQAELWTGSSLGFFRQESWKRREQKCHNTVCVILFSVFPWISPDNFFQLDRNVCHDVNDLFFPVLLFAFCCCICSVSVGHDFLLEIGGNFARILFTVVLCIAMHIRRRRRKKNGFEFNGNRWRARKKMVKNVKREEKCWSRSHQMDRFVEPS